MKNKALAVVAIAVSLLSGVSASAQSQFRKGDFAMNIDYSLGTFSQSDLSSWSDNITQHGIGFTAEYGILGDIINSKGAISVGGTLGMGFGSGDKWSYNGYSGDVDAFRFRIATRGTLHYAFIPQLDTYAGLNFLFVDVNKVDVDYKDEDGKHSKSETKTTFIEPRLFAGCRYMFSDFFGVNAEVSWDRFEFFAIGVSFKF